MRGAIKATAEFALARGGPARIARSLRRGHALVLSYHNIVPDGEARLGDASLHLPVRAFVAQIEALACTHEIVPLDSLLEPWSGRSGPPRAAITFDDAYRGALRIGLNELAKLALPATLFVAPGCLGDQTFWWDRLADDEAGEVPRHIRERALAEFAGQGERILQALPPALGNPDALPPDMHSATEEELRDAVGRSAGLSLGSHSWSHPNLAALNASEVREELDRSLAWLRERFAPVVPWISYPYGRFSDDVLVAASAAGYRGGVSQANGWYRGAANDPIAIPRLNVPAGLSLDGFVARVAGLI